MVIKCYKIFCDPRFEFSKLWSPPVNFTEMSIIRCSKTCVCQSSLAATQTKQPIKSLLYKKKKLAKFTCFQFNCANKTIQLFNLICVCSIMRRLSINCRYNQRMFRRETWLLAIVSRYACEKVASHDNY